MSIATEVLEMRRRSVAVRLWQYGFLAAEANVFSSMSPEIILDAYNVDCVLEHVVRQRQTPHVFILTTRPFLES